MSAPDPELFTIDIGYIDPVDRVAYEQARSDWDQERADRRREALEDGPAPEVQR